MSRRYRQASIWLAALALGACATAGATAPRPSAATAASGLQTPPSSSSASVAQAPQEQPPDVPTRDIQLPNVGRVVLPDGVSIWHSTDRTLPVVHLRLRVEAGANDDSGKPGLAYVTALALAYGAAASAGARDAGPLADQIVVRVTDSSTVFSLDVLEREAPVAVELLGAMLSRAAFRQIDADAARRRVSETSLRADGGALLISPLDIQSFYRARYGAKATTLIAVGAIGLADASRAAEAGFGSWTGGTGTAPTTLEGSQPLFFLEDDPGREHAEIVAFGMAPRFDDPSWAAAQLTAGVAAQRTKTACAEREGGDRAIEGSGAALVPMCLTVRASDAGAAIEQFLADVRPTDNAVPSEAVLLDARKDVTNRLSARIGSRARFADLLAGVAHPGGSPEGLADLSARLRAVTPAAVSQTSAAYLVPARMTFVVKGPSATLRPQLQRLGTVVDRPLQEGANEHAAPTAP